MEKMVVIKLWGHGSWDQLFENVEIFFNVEIESLNWDHIQGNWDLKNDAIKLWGLDSWDQLFENYKIFWLSRPPFWNCLNQDSFDGDHVLANWGLKNGCY